MFKIFLITVLSLYLNAKVFESDKEVKLKLLLIEELRHSKQFSKDIKKELVKSTTMKDLVTILKKVKKDNKYYIADIIIYNSFTKKIDLETKFELMLEMKKQKLMNSYDFYNLYNTIKCGYTYTDINKEIQKEIISLTYLINHYEKYKNLILNNNPEDIYYQPDMYSEIILNDLKTKKIEDKLKKEYILKLKELVNISKKDIKKYYIESIILLFARDKFLSPELELKLKKYYEEYLKTHQYIKVQLAMYNFKYRLYFYLTINLNKKDISKFSTYMKTFTTDNITKKQYENILKIYAYSKNIEKDLIKVILKEYGIENSDLKILKVNFSNLN